MEMCGFLRLLLTYFHAIIVSMNQKKLKELLYYDEDTGIFRWKIRKQGVRINGTTGYIDKDGYNAIRIDGILYFAHRLAWLYVYGKFPKDEIDHINHTRNDNRIRNLRSVTGKENRKNKVIQKNNISGVSGVHWNKNLKKWQAQIMIDRKMKYLGSFIDKRKAIQAREAGKIKYGFHPNHS